MLALHFGCRDTTIGIFPRYSVKVATVGSELGTLPPPYVNRRGGNLIPPTYMLCEHIYLNVKQNSHIADNAERMLLENLA
jgi:hypothetical protein